MTFAAVLRTAPLVAVCVLGLVPARAAMEILSYAPQLHDRFYAGADPAADNALRGADDWSGVGLSTGTRWGTMVSPSFFLSANHWAPGVGAQMEFYPDNSGTSPVIRTVDAGQRLGTSDLWLGHLSSPVPSSINTYPVYIDLGTGFLGTEVWVFGLDETGGTTSQRIGRNVIDDVGSATVGGVPDQEVFLFDYDRIPAEVGGDESLLIAGDSGGPEFALIDGTFYLAGINYFQYVDYVSPDPDGSGASRVSAYISQINSAMGTMSALGERLTVVPEPALPMLLTVGVTALALCRPRRRPAA